MPSYAFFQKQFVPLEEARIGIMTHALHYGTAVFEGIRGNWNSEQQQTYIFRLKEHYERLGKGCSRENQADIHSQAAQKPLYVGGGNGSPVHKTHPEKYPKRYINPRCG